MKVFIWNFFLPSNASLSWLGTSFFPRVRHLWIRCIWKKYFPGSSVCASHSRTLSIVVFFGGLQASDRYQKESYACWFLSLHFESCCIQKPHIFQPFSLFTIEALPRIFGYFCTMSFSYVTLHIWTHLAEWGTNANDRWKYWQDCLHF